MNFLSLTTRENQRTHRFGKQKSNTNKNQHICAESTFSTFIFHRNEKAITTKKKQLKNTNRKMVSHFERLCFSK